MAALAVLVVGVLLRGQLVTRGTASTGPSGTAAAAADRGSELSAYIQPGVSGSSGRIAMLAGANDRADLPGPFAPAPGTLSGYRWPLSNARITQGFGASPGGSFMVSGKRFHDGIDIANFCGARVLAAHDGVVVAAGRHSDAAVGWIGDLAAYNARLDARHLWATLANVVVIDDGNGYRSVYVHFHRVTVKVGQVVRAGDVLGTEGSTGHATGCHLHYSLFSPEAVSQFTTDPDLVKKMLLPAAEIARVDPLLVLPPLSTAGITWGWGASDTP